MVSFNHRQPILSDLSRGREKEEEEWSQPRQGERRREPGFLLASRDQLPAGDFFSPHGEKKLVCRCAYRSMRRYALKNNEKKKREKKKEKRERNSSCALLFPGSSAQSIACGRRIARGQFFVGGLT
ncbi:hypothetical protein B296_00043004, partial [Ensete ventricosum]